MVTFSIDLSVPSARRRSKGEKKIFPSCRLAVVNLPGKGGQPLDIESRTMNHEAAVILGKGQNGIRKLDDFKAHSRGSIRGNRERRSMKKSKQMVNRKTTAFSV